MRYEKPKAGQWVKPTPRGYKMACCDCGLVHRMDFMVLHFHTAKRIPFAKVLFRVFRDNRATASMRRGSGLLAGGRTNTRSVGGRKKPVRANRRAGAAYPAGGSRIPAYTRGR